jgi:hypothetical protein
VNKWLRGTNATVLSLAVIGIFIVVTVFLHSLGNLQWDLTKDKKFTLSEQSMNVLDKLDKDIHVIVFDGGQADPFLSQQVVDLVKEFQRHNKHITFDEYDMLKQPSMAKQYNVDGGGTIVFESGDQKKNISFYQMFMPGQQQDGSYMFDGEQKYTEAILNLTATETHPVYFLTGHNEIAITELNTLKSSLEGVNYVVKELNLYREGKIPDDAQAIFIMGPKTDLNDQETKLIKDYLQGNGKLYLALGFNKDMTTQWKNIDSIMSTLGVQDLHSVAIEPKQSVLFDPLTIVPTYGFHDITNKLDDSQLLTVISLAISLKDDPAVKDYSPTMLLKTTNQAYGETDLEALTKGQSKQDSVDTAGPLNLAYAVEDSAKRPKAVIIGGSNFLSDNEITVQGNRDFAMNSVGWLQEMKDQVTIRPRQGEAYQQALILPNQANMIFYGTVVVFPLCFLLVGGLIWWRRRKG